MDTRETKQVQDYAAMFLKLLENSTTKAMLSSTELYAANIQAQGRILAAAIQARVL